MWDEDVLEYYRFNAELRREHLINFLRSDNPQVWERLRQEADRVRREWVGDQVLIRGIIEFSNYCARNCHYCGINRHNLDVYRYRIPPEEIISTAENAVKMGFKTIVLQSGEDFNYTGSMLAEVVREIKKLDVAITLSVGERSFEDYQMWREAGADRYLLKFETSNAELYKRMHPGTGLTGRLAKLQELRELGYQIGSGMMIGLPGQSIEILANDIMLLKSLKLEMAGIGPFIPHPGTPLAGAENGSTDLTLRALALARLVVPWAHLPATTALCSLNKDGRQVGLNSGANVVMPNLTPLKYRKFYEIYPQKAEVIDPPEKLYEDVKTLIRQMGREVAAGYGHGLLSQQN
ncbi:MAG: [FeFe] hydrogenase H-cluster radical SAM maturase HydE [Candidatus Saccharibacteria bacterium]